MYNIYRCCCANPKFVEVITLLIIISLMSHITRAKGIEAVPRYDGQSQLSMAKCRHLVFSFSFYFACYTQCEWCSIVLPI